VSAPVQTAQPVAKPIVPIQIKKGDRRAAFKSILAYGRSRSGKTRFAASFPRVRFLSDASERGWSTVETMPEECYYEPDWIPEVWPIEDAAQMAEALARSKEDVLAGRILSLCIDSLTFYADSHYQWLYAMAAKHAGNKPIDTRSLYGALAQHLQNIRTDIHRWPCNVIWTALEKAPDSDNPQGGPLLTGQSAQKFPAGCDHVFYFRSYTAMEQIDGKSEMRRYFEARTAPFGAYLAGGRDSGLLPDPLYDPTYRQIAEALDLPDPLAKPAPPVSQPASTRKVVTTTATSTSTMARR
jgi:hypothetical protein